MTLREKLSAFDATLPFEQADPIPVSLLTDPEIYRETCERVFRNSWQVVARNDQLIQPGSFVMTDITGVPVLLWRGHDGVLRAMHNACEHQGYAPLVRGEDGEEGGVMRMAVCPNHRAVYRETGLLHAMPDCANLEELKANGVGLRQYVVAEWGPLVAVHLGTPQESFLELLSPLPEHCGEVLRNIRFHKRFMYTEPYGYGQANTNYLDHCSHCPSVHEEFMACVDLERKTYEKFRFGSVQHIPAIVSTDSHSISVRAGDKDYYWFWPNFTFNVNGDGTFDTNRFIPLGPDQCLVINDTYHDGTKSAAFMEESNQFMNRVQKQDNAACRGLQRGGSSPHFERGFYSRPNDILVHHFHCMLARALGEGKG